MYAGAEDILEGNLKLILGLVWRLILRYQIARGRAPPKKLMLAWINAVLAQRSQPAAYNDVKNFTTDWNDGTALLYV
jgi:filamin